MVRKVSTNGVYADIAAHCSPAHCHRFGAGLVSFRDMPTLLRAYKAIDREKV